VIAFVPGLQAGGTYDFAISSIDEHNKEGEKGRSRRVELVWEPVVEEKPFKPAYIAPYIPPAPVVAPYIPPVVAPAQKRSSVSHASHEIICGDLPETNEIVVKDGEEYTWVTARCGPDGEEALTQEAEALFKVVARSNKYCCEVKKLHRAMNYNRIMAERMDSYPQFKKFVDSLSEDRKEWRVAGDWEKDQIGRISKDELIETFIRCLGTLDIDGDGIIDDDEYATAVRCGLVTQALDLDGDGIIDDEELAAAGDPSAGGDGIIEDEEHAAAVRCGLGSTVGQTEITAQARDNQTKNTGKAQAAASTPTNHSPHVPGAARTAALEADQEAFNNRRAAQRKQLEILETRKRDYAKSMNAISQVTEEKRPAQANTTVIVTAKVEVDAAVESKLNADKMHDLRRAHRKLMMDAFVAVDPDDTEFAPRLDLRQQIETHVADCAQVQQLANHVRHLDCMVVEKDDFEDIVQEWVDGKL